MLSKHAFFKVTYFLKEVLNPFHATGIWFYDVFMGYRMRPLA